MGANSSCMIALSPGAVNKSSISSSGTPLVSGRVQYSTQKPKNEMSAYSQKAPYWPHA
jgi:hypothetical protein